MDNRIAYASNMYTALKAKYDTKSNLQREGELDLFLSVRYTYDKVTGAIGCNQEAYIYRLLVKYGMTNANACKLPMNPGSDLDSLPTPDVPDKIVVHAYAALIGELLYLHCYQHNASTQLLHEQFDLIHVKGDTGTCRLRQNGAQIPHR